MLANHKIYVFKIYYLSAQRKDLKRIYSFDIKRFPLCALWFDCRIQVSCQKRHMDNRYICHAPECLYVCRGLNYDAPDLPSV